MNVRQMNPFLPKSAAPKEAHPLPKPSVAAAPPGGDIFSEKLAAALDYKSFKKDDWIILGIIAALIFEGSRDYVLLCSLGYLFLMGL